MPHIALPEQALGIRSLAEYRPDTGQHLYELAQTLLRGESPLSEAERELIAAFVSHRNQCTFCFSSHAAAARYLFQADAQVVDFVLDDYETAPISAKIKSLLRIADCVQKDARTVSEALVAEARANGAGDRDIHDTVLIAATFCLFNRYVDGLATSTPPPDATEIWASMGERIGKNGYVPPKK
ncbi:MAG: carboxymuconolactone decarboxylase family protein [Saprospiraceae bacterium]|nr:carboxymuconolactone decarboxylase family protein [Saprospiraceae bacterium]